MQMQPTGVYGLQPQATGMYNQTPSYNPQPNRFSPQPSPIQFNPTPPPVQAQSPESTTMQFQPSSVFASMKPGGFTNGNGPQEPGALLASVPSPCISLTDFIIGRYDALRPQATGQGSLLSHCPFVLADTMPQSSISHCSRSRLGFCNRNRLASLCNNLNRPVSVSRIRCSRLRSSTVARFVILSLSSVTPD